MSQAAAFQATYSDWKLIRTRKVVQIVLEVPVEQAGLAYEVLGGMPRTDSEIWCAVARLQQKESAAQPRPSSSDNAPHAGGAHSKSWHEMTPAQQAGLLCNDPAFANFLRGAFPALWTGAADCAVIVRKLCQVNSRSELNLDNEAAMKWRGLVSDYRAWMRSPEVV